MVQLSLRGLRLPRNTVTVFRKQEAPEELQEIDISNEGSHIFVVPDCCASLLSDSAYSSMTISSGTFYVA